MKSTRHVHVGSCGHEGTRITRAPEIFFGCTTRMNPQYGEWLCPNLSLASFPHLVWRRWQIICAVVLVSRTIDSFCYWWPSIAIDDWSLTITLGKKSCAPDGLSRGSHVLRFHGGIGVDPATAEGKKSWWTSAAMDSRRRSERIPAFWLEIMARTRQKTVLLSFS